MPIRVVCACGKALRANDKLAGKRAKCPACGGRINVPDHLPSSEFDTHELVDELDEVSPFDSQVVELQVSFGCKHCKSSLAIDISMVDKQIICPHCNTPLIVPAPEQATKTAVASDTVSAAELAPTYRPKSTAHYQFDARKQQRRQKAIILAGVIGTATIVLLLLVGIKYLNLERAADRDARGDRNAHHPVTGRRPSVSMDGSVPAVKKWLQENLDDPRELEYVKWGEPLVIQRGSSKETSAWTIRLKYRARNPVGAISLFDRGFYVRDDKVIGWDEHHNIYEFLVNQRNW